jgi:cytochrome c oxidase assembly protein subunit 15
VVFLLPYVWFLLARKTARRRWRPRCFGFFILGGLQGAMGWYMVKSGLVDDPRVVRNTGWRPTSSLAFLLFGLMFWTGLGMLQARGPVGA